MDLPPPSLSDVGTLPDVPGVDASFPDVSLVDSSAVDVTLHDVGIDVPPVVCECEADIDCEAMTPARGCVLPACVSGQCREMGEGCEAGRSCNPTVRECRRGEFTRIAVRTNDEFDSVTVSLDDIIVARHGRDALRTDGEGFLVLPPFVYQLGRYDFTLLLHRGCEERLRHESTFEDQTGLLSAYDITFYSDGSSSLVQRL